MKFLQKATLAAAIAAAPFAAQAELKAMDDAMMSATTGQAGVTIEIDMDAAGITIGEVEYTDTQVGADTDGGSVVLQNIKISDTDITQTIDVDGDGSLKIGMTTSGNINLDLGNSAVAGTSAVALKSAAGDITEVVNDVHLEVEMARNDTTIVNLQNAANAAKYGLTGISFNNGAGVSSTAASGSAAIIADMDVRIVDLDVGAFGYTQAQADTRAQSHSTVVAARTTLTDDAGVGQVDYNADGTVQTVYSDAGVTAIDLDDAANAGIKAKADAVDGAQTTVAGQIAGGAAVKLNDITFSSNDDGTGTVNVKQTIWADSEGVYIAMGDINGTLNIGGVELGGSTIGSVAVRNIQLNGMTQRIYGH